MLVAGGMVTSTGSGLSVPDWPTSFGTLNPPMVGGVFYEHGHRVVAGTVALMTLALTIWILKTEQRRAVRRLMAAAAAGILLQAVLGGMTVLFKLPPQISIAHACLGQLVFSLLCAVADAQAPRIAPPGPWAWLAAAAFVQLFLGAVLRHTGGGLAWHLLGAAAVSVIAALTGSVHGGLLLLLQLALGLGALLARKSTLFSLPLAVALPTAHLALGALILAAAFVMASRRWTTSS